MDTRETYRAVREWLSSRGRWRKGSFGSKRGVTSYPAYSADVERTCLAGAFMHILGTSVLPYEVLVPLAQCIDPDYKPEGCFGTIIGFNDMKTTHHEDVLRVLDCAIDSFGPAEA